MAPPRSTIALSLSSKSRMYAVPAEIWGDIGERSGKSRMYAVPASRQGVRVRARVRARVLAQGGGEG